MRCIGLVASLGYLLILTAPVMADQETVKIGTQELVIATPEGQCLFDPSKPGDLRLINATRAALGTTNTLLSVYANCDELVDWRTGKRQTLDHFGQVQTVTELVGSRFSESRASLVKQVCAQMASQGAEMLDEIMPEAAKRIEALMSGVKINESRFLGVVAEDEDACYGGILQRLQTEHGASKEQVCVYATTIIEGKVVYVYQFGLYEDASSVKSVLERVKNNTSHIIQANGG